jgi:hypothetical protein
MPASESASPRKDEVTIHINKQRFVVANPVSGTELRQLGSIPDANQLFLEVPGDENDILVRPDQSYTLKNGSHLYDLPKGTVGAVELETQLAYALEKLEGAGVIALDDGSKLLRWRLEVPGEWAPRAVELALQAPPLYPAQAPSGFDVVGPITFRGSTPSGTGAREVGGFSATHFCWNPAGEIDYTTADGLWRFAKFSESRFLHDG